MQPVNADARPRVHERLTFASARSTIRALRLEETMRLATKLNANRAAALHACSERRELHHRDSGEGRARAIGNEGDG